MLSRWRKDKRGILYLYIVLIMALVACGFVWYVIACAVQAVQVGVGSTISSDKWVSNSTYQTFDLANTFVNNFWTYFLVLLVLGLLYYGYIFSQRKGIPAYG